MLVNLKGSSPIKLLETEDHYMWVPYMSSDMLCLAIIDLEVRKEILSPYIERLWIASFICFQQHYHKRFLLQEKEDYDIDVQLMFRNREP